MTLSLISNMRLGKKIGLASMGMVGLLICTLLLALWAMSRIKGTQDEAQLEAMRASDTMQMQSHIAKSVMYVGTVLMHE